MADSTYTRRKRAAGTDEEASTDRTSNGNHVEVARLHGPVELDDAETIVSNLERVEIEAIASHEVLVADVDRGALGSILVSIAGEDLGDLDSGLFEVRALRRLVACLHGV